MRQYFTGRNDCSLAVESCGRVGDNERFGEYADRDNKRRGVPAAADVGRHDGQVDR